MKIVFFGSDDFALAHLEALHASEHEVVLCVTQPDRPRHRGHKMVVSPLKEFSIAQNIEVFQPTAFKDEQVVTELKRYNADLFVVIAYGRILPDRILSIPKLYSINVHGSLLPSYRGAAPINWAVINGDQETGLTIIKMNTRMDAGDIIAQKSMPIDGNDTSQQVRQRMMQIGAPFLVETVNQIALERVSFLPQEEDQVSIASKLTKSMGLIDWNRSAIDLHNQVRGLQPWPGAFTHCNGKMLKVFDTLPSEEIQRGKPGEVLEVDEAGMLVQTGQGALRIRDVQLESCKRMQACEFVRGSTVECGFCF